MRKRSSPDFSAGASQPQSPPPRRARRVLRALAWLLALLAALLLGAAALVWWWAGSSTSLAAVLTRAAHYLPAGQQLESREVTGTLRSGGHIGWLRWSSPSLAVEVTGARLGWRLAPLLQRRLELGEVHAAQIRITPQGPPSTEPATPLTQLVLPLQISVPFSVEALQWAGPPAVEAQGLAGAYQFDGNQHRLTINGVELAQGRYSARATLQALAPMALDAAVNGTVRTEVPGGGTAMEVAAQATLQGTLATADAQLELHARLRPAAETAAEPMQADAQARLAPWAAQPVQAATATLQALDLAALWPQAPATQLHGTVQAGPADGGTGWAIEAALRNSLAGPWDRNRLPLTALQARAHYDGERWTVPSATASAGAGSVVLQGRFTPATGAMEGQAELRGLRPDALHTALSAAPLAGRAAARMEGERVHFSADIRAAAPSTAPLRINTLSAQGSWQASPQPGTGVLRLDRLLLDALQARITATGLRVALAEQSAQGELALSLPGAAASAQGQIAPHSGAGDLRLQWTDIASTQRWLAGLPWVGAAAQAALQGTTAQGAVQIQAGWKGGWRTLAQQLQAARDGTAPPAASGDAFALQATLTTPQLDVSLPAANGTPGSEAPGTAVQLRAVQAELSGTLAQAALSLRGEARMPHAASGLRAHLATRLTGGWTGAAQWQAQVSELRLQAQDARQAAPWTLQLDAPLSLTAQTQNTQTTLHASAGQARLNGPQPGTVALRWEPVRLAAQAGQPLQLQTRGSLQGLPMAWADAFAATGSPAQQPLLARMGLAADMVLNGQWNVDTTGSALRASASLGRASGDLRILAGDATAVTAVQSSGQGTGAGAVAATATEASARPSGTLSGTPAGVRQAEISVEADGDALRARLRWASDRAGEIDAGVETRIARAGADLTWAADAPLAGQLRARLPDLGVWSALAPPGWRVRGTLDANAALSGTRDAPRWSGTLGADDLAVRSVVDGVDLQGGRLRATLRGSQLDITEFRLQGGRGSSARIAGFSGNRTAAPQDGGLLSGTGRVTWAEGAGEGLSGIAMDFQAEAKALQVLVRADRQVSLSGQLQAQLQQGQIRLRGQLTTDRATIILPDESAPSLGSDVVVRSAAKDREDQAKAQASQQAAAQAQTARPPDIAVTLNLGRDFALSGHGITTRLRGALEIRSSAAPGATPRVTGEIRTEEGRYRAWGQMLDVETGLIRFNGPYDNPSLDILALRPNISVRAGVQVTGSAQAPRVRLYSDPELPDAEKLSWVVLGRDAAAGGAEAAVLQQAALALLGRGGNNTTANAASRLGLDEIGFKGPGAGEDASAAALTFGKRLSKDLYVTYERSLSGTLGTLYIFYDLSRRLTLRGQTGEKSAVDIIYTMSYD